MEMKMKSEQLSAVYVIFKCSPNVPYAGHILFLFLTSASRPGRIVVNLTLE